MLHFESLSHAWIAVDRVEMCRLPLVQAGRFWREGVTTFVALERNWSSIKDSEFPPGFKASLEC